MFGFGTTPDSQPRRLIPMTRSSRRVLPAALAAVACVAVFATAAQANTTLPGINGKIVYTTNAANDTVTPGLAPKLAPKCSTFPFPTGALLGNEFFNADFPFNVLDCTAEIATINSDGSGFTQVTNNAVQDDMPAWLPQDGSRIAYQSLQNEESCNSSDQPRGSIQSLCLWNIWSSAPDGSSNTQLTGLTND